MKHNSLWTIAHLLKSDVGWGASHHRAYSVCWQRRPLINKACSLKQVPKHEFSFERQFRKLTDESECLLVCTQPFGFCVSFPKSQRCFRYKQQDGVYFSTKVTKVWHGYLQMFKCLSSGIECPLLSLWEECQHTMQLDKISIWKEVFFSQWCPQVVTPEVAWNFKYNKALHILRYHLTALNIHEYVILVKCKVCFLNNETMKSGLSDVVFPAAVLHNMQSTQFTNSAYPHYQHMEVFSNRYLRAANGLKSVILISKHLTLEWWLLAGGYPCCLSRLHLKKMTELLSDTYSTGLCSIGKIILQKITLEFQQFSQITLAFGLW